MGGVGGVGGGMFDVGSLMKMFGGGGGFGGGFDMNVMMK